MARLPLMFRVCYAQHTFLSMVAQACLAKRNSANVLGTVAPLMALSCDGALMEPAVMALSPQSSWSNQRACCSDVWNVARMCRHA